MTPLVRLNCNPRLPYPMLKAWREQAEARARRRLWNALAVGVLIAGMVLMMLDAALGGL